MSIIEESTGLRPNVEATMRSPGTHSGTIVRRHGLTLTMKLESLPEISTAISIQKKRCGIKFGIAVIKEDL
jgi:hypothetical protein